VTGADARAAPSQDMAPLRILLVHERYRQYGGEDAVFDAQSELLAGAGHVVERLEVDNDEIDPETGVRGRLALAAATVWSRDGIRRVTAAARAFRPDVVHIHNTFPLLSPAIYGPVRALGPAVVQTLHNYRLVCPSAVLFRDGHPCEECVGRIVAWPGVVHRCYRDSALGSGVIATMLAVHRMRRTWRRDVDLFVMLAAFARDRLVRGGVPRGRTLVVPNFVDSAGPPATGPGEGALFVGRLTADKGIPTLLDAWRLLVPGGGTLRIAGDGPMRPLAEQAAGQLSGIEYLGPLAPGQVRDEMRRARVVVVPSRWYESCPMTVLEAFASGRPVIASGHGGLAELVDDGVTGLHVRPGDPKDLARAIARAIGDPDGMVTLGRAARDEWARRFSPEVARRQLDVALRRAIALRHGKSVVT